MSVSSKRTFQNQLELIEAIKREMMEVTVESLDPWMPMGGYFTLMYKHLPSDVNRDELALTIESLLNEVRGVSVERVIVGEDIIAVYVQGTPFQTQKELEERLMHEAAMIIPVNVRLPYVGVRLRYSALPDDLDREVLKQKLADLVSTMHGMTLTSMVIEEGLIMVSVK